MSHVRRQEIKIRHWSSLVKAFASLGGTIRESETYQWYGRAVDGERSAPEGFTAADLGKCQWEVTFPESMYPRGYRPYSVGIVKRGQDYVLLFDEWYEGGLVPIIGKGASKLTTPYAVELAKAKMRKAGFHVKKSTSADGRTTMEFVR